MTSKLCGFVPPTPGYAPCTRPREREGEIGHEGPCAHPLLEPYPRRATGSSETCYACGTGTAHEYLVIKKVTWGNPTMRYGEHVFENVPSFVWDCHDCGDGYMDSAQIELHESALNHLIKRRLGIDWLALSRDARRRVKG